MAASLVVLGSLLSLDGCKKKSDESDEPLKLPEKKKTEASADATSSAAPTASASAAPAASSSASASTSASAASSAAAPPASSSAASTPEPAPSGPVAAGGGQGIEKCCAAINAIQSSGVSKETKTKASAAAAACGGISQLVKTGRTSRAAALTQIRAAMAGATMPAACN